MSQVRSSDRVTVCVPRPQRGAQITCCGQSALNVTLTAGKSMKTCNVSPAALKFAFHFSGWVEAYRA